MSKLNCEAESFESASREQREFDDWVRRIGGWVGGESKAPLVAQKGIGAAYRRIEPQVTRAVKAASAKQGLPAEKVCWVQNVLNKTIGEALVEDGIHGPATRAGVVRFQTSHALAADGIVGPRTEVALIQAALNQIAQASLVPVSGVLDPQTTQQIRRFQSRSKLEPDGIVGPRTRAAMVAALGGRCKIAAPRPAPKPGGGMKPPPKPQSECPCTSELLEQARRQCRSALYDNVKACVLGDPIIATKVPHAADQIASQISTQANSLVGAFQVVKIIITVIGLLITAAKIASIGACIWDQVRAYQGCVSGIDACEQECRSKGLL